jgi:hypothetical protein
MLSHQKKPLFLGSQLNLVSTSSMYLEQNVKHSSATYASAIEPSSRSLFLTYHFKVYNRLSIGYIQPYCTGPRSNASSGRCTARCTNTSTKIGGNIFSSFTKIIGISCLISANTSLLRVLLHNFLKKFPNSATAS